MLGPDNQILERPPCATPGCTSKNIVRIVVGGALRCGDCVNEMMKEQNRQTDIFLAEKAKLRS